MSKKLFGITILSLLVAGSLSAGSHGSVFKVEGTCANKQFTMRMMDELPLHIAGEMNCVDRVQIKGEKIDTGSTCTYSGQTTLGQPPILSWNVTFQTFYEKGDSIFWRSNGSNPFAARGGPGKTSICQELGNIKVYQEVER